MTFIFFHQCFFFNEIIYVSRNYNNFLLQNINLYPSCMQFCEKRRCEVPIAAQDWIIGNRKFRRDSLVNCTGYSMDEGF